MIHPILLESTPDPSEKRLYDITSAATYLGITIEDLGDILVKGEIPHVDFPYGLFQRSLRVDRRDMDAFISHYKKKGSSGPLWEHTCEGGD